MPSNLPYLDLLAEFIGVEVPFNRLLELKGAEQIDLDTLSIVELFGALIVALDAALSAELFRADLSHTGVWLVIPPTLALLQSRLLSPLHATGAWVKAMRCQLHERAAIRKVAGSRLVGLLQLPAPG